MDDHRRESAVGRRLVSRCAGYATHMFRSIPALFRTGRKAAFPLTRTALFFLAWRNRHTVALWFRSLKREYETFGFDLSRLRQLLRGLWAVSSDRRTTNAEPLHVITVRPDGFGVEAREGWIGRATVETLLAPIAPHETTLSVA